MSTRLCHRYVRWVSDNNHMNICIFAGNFGDRYFGTGEGEE